MDLMHHRASSGGSQPHLGADTRNPQSVSPPGRYRPPPNLPGSSPLRHDSASPLKREPSAPASPLKRTSALETSTLAPVSTFEASTSERDKPREAHAGSSPRHHALSPNAHPAMISPNAQPTGGSRLTSHPAAPHSPGQDLTTGQNSQLLHHGAGLAPLPSRNGRVPASSSQESRAAASSAEVLAITCRPTTGVPRS